MATDSAFILQDIRGQLQRLPDRLAALLKTLPPKVAPPPSKGEKKEGQGEDGPRVRGRDPLSQLSGALGKMGGVVPQLSQAAAELNKAARFLEGLKELQELFRSQTRQVPPRPGSGGGAAPQPPSPKARPAAEPPPWAQRAPHQGPIPDAEYEVKGKPSERQAAPAPPVPRIGYKAPPPTPPAAARGPAAASAATPAPTPPAPKQPYHAPTLHGGIGVREMERLEPGAAKQAGFPAPRPPAPAGAAPPAPRPPSPSPAAPAPPSGEDEAWERLIEAMLKLNANVEREAKAGGRAAKTVDPATVPPDRGLPGTPSGPRADGADKRMADADRRMEFGRELGNVLSKGNGKRK